MTESSQLNTVVIYGSVRRKRQGIKAARFVNNKLQERGHLVTLIDPHEYPLPFLDLMHKEYESGEAPEAMEKVSQILRQADGYIIVSAEYNHSIPASLKNLLDHFQTEYHYKPSGIVTYSAGPFGGVRALVNLRGILAELGTPSIPSAFPISQIHNAFDDDGKPLDPAYDQRIVKFLDEFEWYENALKYAREHEKCSDELPTQQAMCRE
ncbi:MAG: NAD(P)H-dependent oxidoreductase [Gammaproteobacteria bacterium]|nr:NAD(P)H-dependent oxidoreductase [Gammaproteobacteria bacterium]